MLDRDSCINVHKNKVLMLCIVLAFIDLTVKCQRYACEDLGDVFVT